MAEYDAFAENYVTQQEHGDLANTIEYPAMIAAVGKQKNKALLDAGCGIGRHATHYAKRGAKVTAIDLSQQLLTKISHKDILVIRHDLEKKLPFEKNAFDTITCSLVLDHLKRINKTLAEFHRVLRDSGTVYCSIPNPLFHQEEPLVGISYEGQDVDISGNYFYPRRIKTEYDAATITLYHRTLTDYFAAFRAAGFTVDALCEVQPPRSMKKKDILGYSFASRNPLFYLFTLVKEQ